MSRSAVTFECQGQLLSGILEIPASANGVAVVVVTGGPQYRIGSHRQFVKLGAAVAAAGFACLRFDQRGHGDSEGEPPGFTNLDADIRSAVDFMQQRGFDRIVLWGLCDAASAALLYAWQDPRVTGLVLLNPWVRRDASEARAQLKSYYPSVLRSRSFWQRLLSGRVNLLRASKSLLDRLVASRKQDGSGDFVDAMLDGAEAFKQPVLLVLSEADLTAAEFEELVRSGPWAQWLARPGVTVQRVSGANHTFSTAEHRQVVSETTCSWLAQSL